VRLHCHITPCNSFRFDSLPECTSSDLPLAHDGTALTTTEQVAVVVKL
jgi:hypothetical protein